MMRPEVEEALHEALQEWNGDDLPNALIEQASSDTDFNLSWSKPEEARRILRALIELGVRLGAAAGKAAAMREIDAAWNECGADPKWGAAQQYALRLAGDRIEASDITVASVLEGGK